MRTRIYLYFCAIALHLSILGFAQDRAPVSGQGSSSPGNFPSQIQSTTQYQSINQAGMQRYGHNFFQSDVSGQEMTSGALPRDYRLGPGDQLGIFLGGKTQENFQLAVSMDGKLYIPTIGVLYVSGLTIDDFRQVLDKRLRTFYSDYSLNIMLTMPKMVGISVIGEVRAPGNYSGSALGSILDFIVKARGVTNDGSFRNIQIIRQDSLVARVDLYDFMMRPRGRQEVSLQSGDIIFVPVLASTIAVSGEVNREAIYELNPNTKESVCDLVELAGGFTGLAYLQKVKISRMLQDGSRKAFYIDFNNQPCEKNDTSLVVQDKDRIHIFSIEDQAPHDSVAVFGEVNHPGSYEYHKNMRVSDLVLQAGSLKRSAYMLTAELAKVDPGNKIKMKSLELQRVMRGEFDHDVLLEADDQIFIRKIPKWDIGALVEVQGEALFPGFYPIKKDSTYLSQILKAAGGFTQEALVKETKLVRERDAVIEDKEYERLAQMSRSEMSNSEYEYFVMKHNSAKIDEIVVDFERLMVHQDSTEDILLKDGDLINIPKRPGVVYITGRVSKPGGILFKPGADFDYYIDKAGGYTWDAHKKDTKIIKVTGEIKKVGKIKKFEPGDRIFIPRKQDRNYWRSFYDVVLVLGQLAAVYLVVQTATK
jgi:protein involved in polysaccharide export with SLBB domain